MSTTVPAARPAPAEESLFQKCWQIAKQVFLVWAITQLATKFLSGQFQNNGTPSVPSTTTPDGTPQAINASLLPPLQVFPAWQLGQNLSVHIRLSTSPIADVLSAGWARNEDEVLPSVVWEDFTFGNWSEARSVFWEVTIPESTKSNGSLWADVFLVKEGASPNPHDDKFDPTSVHHTRKLLTPYIPKAKARKEKNLLSASANETIEEEEPDVIVPHWHGNLSIGLVSSDQMLPYSQLPPVLSQHIYVVPGVRDSTGTKGQYKPIVYPNDFWHLRSQYQPVNQTTTTLPLRIEFYPMSYFKFQTFASLTHGFNEAAKQKSAGSGAELDEIKRMLVETNPWFLAVTALVTVLHMVFEMLAFKSDVSHWRQKKELVGVSVRTIITNVFVQIIILLYLIDNNTETSWMILFGSGMGVLIEAWKITKTVDISVVPAPPGSLLPYKLNIKDKHVLSEDERKTQEYDRLAYRYVSYVAIPCLAGYTIYSLVYETHRGWYSFVITTLTSFVYMFGFAQLIPQLIINYKLKSVAHMPMKAMIYKTLSTVVDDFFAFCIKMPFLHRLACFRDDVVFLVFLYQRWIYRVDAKRVNEYGQVLVEDATGVGKPVESKKDR